MNIKIAATLLALPLLAACAPEVDSTIHLSDVQKVLATGNAISTPATLRIPQPNEDDCRKGLDDLAVKLKALTPITGTPACIHVDGSDFVEVTTAIQIVTPAAKIAGPNLLALVAQSDTDGNIALNLSVLQPVAEVAETLTGDDSSSASLDPTKFMLHINNDTAADIDALPGEVMLDGKPHLGVDAPITIAAGTDIAIAFNDVATAFMDAGNSYQFIAIDLPK